jgi:hypothetical protein
MVHPEMRSREASGNTLLECPSPHPSGFIYLFT